MSEALAVVKRGPSVTSLGLAHAGVTSQKLAKYMAPLRVGDPLGLGFGRPPPPPDPDVYDQEAENKDYSRSTLTSKERAELDETIKNEGFMTIHAVRKFIGESVCAALTEVSGLDPEMMIVIDARTNYKIFVAGDNVYTREELYDHFPFHELNMQPEAVFTQQEIGLFPADAHSMRPDELCYMARDVGDDSVEFITVEDLVGLATRKNHKMKRALIRAIKTKVYIGKEPWEDFKAMQQLIRGTVRMARAQQASGGGINIVAALLGGGAGPAPKLITDPETLEAERRAREEESARREEALQIREAELRRREEEIQQRIDADIQRLERMFASKGLATLEKNAAAVSAAADSAADNAIGEILKSTSEEPPAENVTPIISTGGAKSAPAAVIKPMATTTKAMPVKPPTKAAASAKPIVATATSVRPAVIAAKPIIAPAKPIVASAAVAKPTTSVKPTTSAKPTTSVKSIAASAVATKPTTAVNPIVAPAMSMKPIVAPAKPAARKPIPAKSAQHKTVPAASSDISALFAEMFPDGDSVLL
jgi:hypothetical protein